MKRTQLLTTALTGVLALFVMTAGFSGAVTAAEDDSPMAGIFSDDEDDGIGATISEKATGAVAWGLSTANSVSHDIKVWNAERQGETLSTPEEEAQNFQTKFNNNSQTLVDDWNSKNYPASENYDVLAVNWKHNDETATRYIVASYNSTNDNWDSAEVVETTDKEVDRTITMCGPLVEPLDSDKMTSTELLGEYITEYAETGDRIENDNSYVKELGKDYAGHINSDMSGLGIGGGC